ncbi:DeoR/GlpR transcriptional regulator [Stappia sp. F7233]|uniref:DeoR/GlpR transcriptional regulator n=1 Tax=Stappia albiluteola TaxID=2758565 RepID=A0A839AE71_9HYPH|nr:DeoR/GlpR family DNA-binding transcription regulator [Stappia albiluteola]MBA5776889.1 DeoR/GlpR transcriptional regulator [Stappia albiluteola]
MKQSRRHDYILNLLQERQFCAIAQLATELDVSDETIRRDIKKLDKAGKARRVHGGVTLVASATEGPFVSRMEEGADAKRRIAHAFASKVPAEARLFIDGGTTNCYLARELAGAKGLTVLTNSLEVARILASQPGIRLIMAPGEVDHDDNAVYGSEAIAFIRNFQLDIAIFTAAAVDLAGDAVYDIKPQEAHLKREIANLAGRVAVLADARKFGKSGFVRFCQASDAWAIVTDASLPKEQRAFAKKETLMIAGG